MMADYTLKLLGDPSLRQRCQAVESIRRPQQELAEALLEGIEEYDGVGLAAPQLGGTDRLVAVRPDLETAPELLVNPEIQKRSGPNTRQEEGCLSIPGLQVEVPRAHQIKLHYQTLEGEPRTREAAGFIARVIQHEVDHLEGKLIVDYLSPLKRRMLLDRWKKKMQQSATSSGVSR